MENLLASVTSVLAHTPARWQQLTALPADLLNRPPKAGEWSAVECLLHLLDTERDVFPVRVRLFLAGQDFPAFDPDAEGTPSSNLLAPAELAAEFARLRRENLELVAGLTEADLPRRVRHAELGPVTLAELLNEWAAHDFNHTIQAERALMQPFIAGSGPWQPYFKDHLA